MTTENEMANEQEKEKKMLQKRIQLYERNLNDGLCEIRDGIKYINTYIQGYAAMLKDAGYSIEDIQAKLETYVEYVDLRTILVIGSIVFSNKKEDEEEVGAE